MAVAPAPSVNPKVSGNLHEHKTVSTVPTIATKFGWPGGNMKDMTSTVTPMERIRPTIDPMISRSVNWPFNRNSLLPWGRCP